MIDSQFLLRLFAQFHNFELAHLVRQRLSRVGNVAVLSFAKTLAEVRHDHGGSSFFRWDDGSIEHLPNIDAVPRDMQDALERFNNDALEIVHAFLATLESQQPPPIIYNYTNDVGLKGILETGQLWLTDIFSLNDPSELTHGFSVAIDALTSSVA